MKKLVALIFAVTLMFSGVAAWGDGGKQWRYGGYWTREVLSVKYEGQGWAFPCVDQNGKQAFGIDIRFYAGSPGKRDTGWVKSPRSTSPKDCGKKEVFKAYIDDLQWDPGYKTVFKYQFSWRPVGAGIASTEAESSYGVTPVI